MHFFVCPKNEKIYYFSKNDIELLHMSIIPGQLCGRANGTGDFDTSADKRGPESGESEIRNLKERIHITK